MTHCYVWGPKRHEHEPDGDEHIALFKSTTSHIYVCVASWGVLFKLFEIKKMKLK